MGRKIKILAIGLGTMIVAAAALIGLTQILPTHEEYWAFRLKYRDDIWFVAAATALIGFYLMREIRTVFLKRRGDDD